MDPSDIQARRLAELTGAKHLAAAALDPDGHVREWTPGAERLTGFRCEEIIGRPLGVLLDPEVPDEVRRRLTEGPDGVSELVLRHREGHPIGVEVFSAARTRDVGAGRVLVVTKVPTERDLDEDLRSWALDQVPVIGAIFDTDARYLHLNDYARRLWNIPADRLLGRNVMEDLPQEGTAAFLAAIRRGLETGEPSVFEASQKAGHRTQVWAIHNTPLKDSSGEVRGLYTLGIDTTREYEARERLTLLNRASASIGGTLDVGNTARELAQVVVPGLADLVTVDVLDHVVAEQEATPRGSEEVPFLHRLADGSVLEGTPESVLKAGDAASYAADSPLAQALRTGRSALWSIAGDPPLDTWAGLQDGRAAQGELVGLHSAMVVPLRARGSIFGVASFFRHRYPEDFSHDDLLLAEEITARAAVCVDNAQRYTRQRATALTLQHSLLPQKLPRQSAVEVAGRYLASDTRGGVGGDWFDVIPLSGARVALVVGDVVGHGIHASATMGRLRTAVRTLADAELPPDELLTRLDDLIGSPASQGSELQFESDTGSTCLYAVYDPVSRSCTLARAGHPPPALVLPDGTVEFLDVPAGPPLGLGGLPYEKLEIQLPRGSLLALYTDGLVESRERDIDEGLVELRKRLAVPSDSLEETCDQVLGMLRHEPPDDDVALLLARTQVMEPRHIVTWEFASDPAVVATARERVARQLEEWGLEEAVFTTEIVVSELVTNAIRHASGQVQLRLILENTLICEVTDSSDTFPRLRRARTFDEGGRGLLLVAQLSHRWGTRSTATGKVIWADQLLPARSSW